MENTQTRSIKELLQLMLNNKKLFEKGLCMLVSDMYDINIITYDELLILTNYINNNKPKKPINFLEYFYQTPNSGYFWKFGKWYPRKVWLKHHIELNS